MVSANKPVHVSPCCTAQRASACCCGVHAGLPASACCRSRVWQTSSREGAATGQHRSGKRMRLSRRRARRHAGLKPPQVTATSSRHHTRRRAAAVASAWGGCVLSSTAKQAAQRGRANSDRAATRSAANCSLPASPALRSPPQLLNRRDHHTCGFCSCSSHPTLPHVPSGSYHR